MRNANFCVGLLRSRRKAAVTPELSPKLGNLQIIKLLLTGDDAGSGRERPAAGG